MCGIAGSVNHPLPYKNIDAVMLHRGPDGQQGYSSGNVDLYHLRLSIVDIDGGAQPMHLGNRYTIIFNGEIYNHRELKVQFGLECQTNSDCETLLLLYSKYGAAMLQHLEGMFVFVIYDKKENSLFIARDRAGKKPLYIFHNGKEIVFASELNCLKSLLPLEMDRNQFFHYTRMGAFYRTCTPYKHVTELAAGTYLEIDCHSLKCNETKYWDIHNCYTNRRTDRLSLRSRMR